ncbi:hypothetical protein HQ585_09430 [candidate division KSB1 bacterium]|nr:hypothetical protein [candidate division KSB1 bacterium]
MKSYTCSIWLVSLLISGVLFGQGQGQRHRTRTTALDQFDSLRTTQNREMRRLRQRLEALEKVREKKGKESKIQALLEKAKSMSEQKKKTDSETRKFHGGLRQQSALNPNISIGGEFYFSAGKSESDLNRLPSETEWGTGQLFMREVELGVESALDPFSRGKVFIGFDGDAVSVEEAYITWLNFPLSTNLKLGKFKNQFGQLNRYHNHALPQFDRPRVLVQFFGNEQLHGIGLSGNILLPRLWADVNELDLEVISGGNSISFTNEGEHNLIYVTRLKNYYDLNRSTYLEIGFSGVTGHNDPAEMNRTWIGSTDITVKWQPPGRSKYKGVEWRTEFLYSARDTSAAVNAWGAFSSLQIRLGARTLMSVRADYTQLPWDNTLWERGGALALDYWQSEFVLIRFQYTMVDRNFNESDHRFILHTCWAMGPHKHDAY